MARGRSRGFGHDCTSHTASVPIRNATYRLQQIRITAAIFRVEVHSSLCLLTSASTRDLLSRPSRLRFRFWFGFYITSCVRSILLACKGPVPSPEWLDLLTLLLYNYVTYCRYQHATHPTCNISNMRHIQHATHPTCDISNMTTPIILRTILQLFCESTWTTA